MSVPNLARTPRNGRLDFCQSCSSPRAAAHILTLSSPFPISREAEDFQNTQSGVDFDVRLP